MKILGIMQPYFFPYIGYFQLISAVNEFVIYDNIKYTKKGWINRNRILSNESIEYISLPLKKDSDFLNVVDRKIADTWNVERSKLLNKISSLYRKSPYFNEIYSLIEECLFFDDKNSYDNINLFNFLYNSVKLVNRYLGIDTPLIVSSTVDIDHNLKAEDKVLAFCKKLGATSYVNAIGGTALYNKERFKANDVQLNFIKSQEISYKQFKEPFVPWLSIIDVMMFNSREEVRNMLTQFDLV